MKQLGYSSPNLEKDFRHDIIDILDDVGFIKKGKIEYLNAPAVFDIEASSFYDDKNEKQATMYAWVFGLNGRCIRGRTWGEFMNVIDIVSNEYKLGFNRRVIVYVHNLAYEFQWIRKRFQWDKVFATDTRKVLYAITTNGIEFRCSYILSGYSLATLGKQLIKYHVGKMVGDLDYDKIRHSRTPLTATEWRYILNDGLVVMAHIQEEIERLGDIAHIPLTKTGYVRDQCRQNCLRGTKRWEYVKKMNSLTLDERSYNMLKRGYMGGFTHANVRYVGKTIKNVHSYDFTSSYPAVMLSEKFPMSRPYRVSIENKDQFYGYLKHFCCLFKATFRNLSPKVSYESYISLSRCSKAESYILNNGRILEADTVTLTITEQDFYIIEKLYSFDEVDVSNFNIFYKEYLPSPIVESVLDLYRKKTELKNVKGMESEYQISKGMLNSCYGMCVTDPCKDEQIYNGEWTEKRVNISEAITEYNKNQQRFLYYPWGVWITAYARANLFTGIIEFGNDYIYSDTDSIKVINIDKHLGYFDEYNRKIQKKINACLQYHGIDSKRSIPLTKDNVAKPMGVWDYEGMYDKFKTLGAKRYMTEKNGELNITIAGVSKTNGVEYLKYKYGKNANIFKNFTENLFFPAHYSVCGVDKNGSGKLCHTYIDHELKGNVVDYMGSIGEYSELSSVHLENAEYTLNLADDFTKLILGIKMGYIK